MDQQHQEELKCESLTRARSERHTTPSPFLSQTIFLQLLRLPPFLLHTASQKLPKQT